MLSEVKEEGRIVQITGGKAIQHPGVTVCRQVVPSSFIILW